MQQGGRLTLGERDAIHGNLLLANQGIIRIVAAQFQLLQDAQLFNNFIDIQLNNAVNQRAAAGIYPYRAMIEFDIQAQVAVARRFNGGRQVQQTIFLRVSEILQGAIIRFDVQNQLGSHRFVNNAPFDYAQAISDAFLLYEQDFDRTMKERSGLQYSMMIGQINGTNIFEVINFFAIPTIAGVTAMDEAFYDGYIRQQIAGRTELQGGGLRYVRRGRATLHVAPTQNQRDHIMERLRYNNTIDDQSRLYSFMLSQNIIQSYQYSDFAFMEMGSPSYEYGICTLECFEHIRCDGIAVAVQNTRCNKKVKSMIIRQLLTTRFQENNFNTRQIENIVSGDVFGTMAMYKEKYPEKTFALFSVHDQKVYIATLEDGEGIINEIIYNRFSDDAIMDVFEQSEWWAVYEKMHLSPLSRTQIRQFYRTERLKYNCTFQEFLRKLVNQNKQRVLSDGGQLLIEEIADNYIDIAARELNLRDGKPKAAYRLKRTGKIKDDYQKIYENLSARNIVLKSFEEYLQEDTPLSDREAVVDQYRNKNLEDLRKTGILTYDIETVLIPIEDLSYKNLGNAQPVMLCVYGYAMIDAQQRAGFDPDYDYLLGDNRIQRIEVKETFHGFDCVDKFVNWLIVSGVLRMSPLDKEHKDRRPNHEDYLKEYQNVIIAHNGAKFDFRWIFDKIVKFAEIDVIGDLSHLKCFSAKNVKFLDSMQILPFSLAKLCKAVGCVKQKFPYEVENVTIENYQSKYNELEIYCMRDCECLHEAYLKYVKERAGVYYNCRGFVSNLFPISASSGAVDLFRELYQEEDINSYKAVYETLAPYYMGGITCVFSAYCNKALSFDVNGSYNAAMHNLIPTEPIWDITSRSFFKSFQYVVYSSPDQLQLQISRSPIKFFSEGFRFKNTHCYKVLKFIFDESENYPSLSQKRDGRLYNCSESDSEQWIWGVKLNFALKHQKLYVEVSQVIEFGESHIFRKFVQDKTRLRKQAKSEGNLVMDLVHKLDSNSVYGKMGQALNDKIFYGTMQQIQEFILMKRVTDDNFTVKSVKPIISLNIEMYQLKYRCQEISQHQIGHMKHIASYITTLGHIYLYRMILLISSTFTDREARICYTDTDSTFVDISQCFSDSENLAINEIFKATQVPCQELEDLWGIKQKIQNMKILIENNLSTDDDAFRYLNHRFLDKGGDDRMQVLKQQVNLAYQSIQAIYQENRVLNYLKEVKVIDGREMQFLEKTEVPEDVLVPIIDSNVPGSYKIEKFIIEGYFLGSKMYATQCFDSESMFKLVKTCKMKGVREDKRIYEDYQRLYQSVFARQYSESDVNFVEEITNSSILQIKQLQFRALDTGVRITNIVKYITPTLYKRRFTDNYGRYSAPFKSYNNMCLFEGLYKNLYDDLRELVKNTVFAGPNIEEMKGQDVHYREADRQIGQTVKKAFIEKVKNGLNEEEEKEEDQIVIRLERFLDDGIRCRPLVLSKLTVQSEAFDRVETMLRNSGVSSTLIKLNEILDAAVRAYNSKYYDVVAKIRFFAVEEVRRMILRLLFLFQFTKTIIGNDLIFYDIIQFIDECIKDSYDAEHDTYIRKTMLDECFMVVNTQFDFFSNEIFDRIEEEVFGRDELRNVFAQEQRIEFKNFGTMMHSKIEEFVHMAHHNRKYKVNFAKRQLFNSTKVEIDKKVKILQAKAENLKKRDFTKKIELHLKHLHEVLQFFLDSPQNIIEKMGVDFRNYVKETLTRKSKDNEGDRMRCVIFYWRIITDNPQLFYDRRWDAQRHWTGPTGLPPSLKNCALQFWGTYIDESFAFNDDIEEDDDEEEEQIDQGLRQRFRRIIEE